MKKVFLIVVFGILILVMGAIIGGYGFSLVSKANNYPPSTVIAELAQLNLSDIIAITSMGSVSSITEDKLTLVKDSALLEMDLSKDLRVYKVDEERNYQQAEIGDVSVSDSVSVYARITEEGKIIAQNITILQDQ
jgi:hypothetical protein